MTAPAIVAVTYFRIPRDQDGRRSRYFDREFENVLRWFPESEDISDDHPGRSALRSLREGQDISVRQMDDAIAYLDRSYDYYQASPDEPYVGRNAEACRDVLEMLRILYLREVQ